MTQIIVGLIGWYRKQIRTGINLFIIIPVLCFLLGVMTAYQNEYAEGVAMAVLLGLFSFIASALYGDWLGGFVLAFMAFIGEALAILLFAYPTFVISITATLIIGVVTNKEYREWRTEKNAFKRMNQG